MGEIGEESVIAEELLAGQELIIAEGLAVEAQVFLYGRVCEKFIVSWDGSAKDSLAEAVMTAENSAQKVGRVIENFCGIIKSHAENMLGVNTTMRGAASRTER